MRTKYSNPYFKNNDMRSKLVTYLDNSRPQMEGNVNINEYEEAQLPISERAGKTGASWINKDSVYRSTSRSPITRHFQQNTLQDDSLMETVRAPLNVTDQSQFGFHDTSHQVNNNQNSQMQSVF